MKQTNFKLGRSASQKRFGGKKKALLGIFVVLIIVASAVAWLFVNTDKATLVDNSAETTTKQIESDKADQKTENDTSSLPDNSTSITPKDVPTSSTLTVESPTFSQTAGIVNTSAKVAGSNSEGTCVITFKNADDRPVIRQINSSKMICSTSISEVEFQKIGTWNLNITFYNGNIKAEVNKDVTIN